MKKKTFFLLIAILIFTLFVFLNKEGSRYIGVNYVVEEHKISNYRKIIEFYQRHFNYINLEKKINQYSTNKNAKIINLSLWVYKNIKRAPENSDVIDNHPWTIVERKMGKDDQFSDILSVLLVYSNTDSFFYNKISNIRHPITFFKYESKWSIVDPYYGVYFLDKNGIFSYLGQDKNDDWIMYHLLMGKVTHDNYNIIFYDKNFHNFDELINYYNKILSNLPNSQEIDSTNIYKRGLGSRSYVQKPLHRIYWEFYKIFN